MRGGREAVMNAAIRVFAERGYAGSSIREICKAAGVTKPVLYYYFRSKEHLYQELMIDCFSHYLTVLTGASRRDGSLRDRLVRIVYNDLHSVKEAPLRAQFIMRIIFSPEGKRPYFNFVKEMEKQRQVIAGVLQDGVETGAIHGNPRDLATALMGMDLFAILENIFTGRKTLNRRTAERHVDILLQGCTEGTTAPSASVSASRSRSVSRLVREAGYAARNGVPVSS